MQPEADECQHIMDSGRRCQTPPVKGKPFCYYHGRLHATFILPGHPAYEPPILENRHSVQIALNHIFLAQSKNLIDRKTATSMAYTLQLVMQNLSKGLNTPDIRSVSEITPAMQTALHLDEKLENTTVRDADEDTPRSTDVAPRCRPLRMGVNNAEPYVPNPERALQRSDELHTKKFSRSTMPEFVPELDPEEWLRITADLPPKGEPGSALQQANCRRVLQILNYDQTRRRMYGAKCGTPGFCPQA